MAISESEYARLGAEQFSAPVAAKDATMTQSETDGRTASETSGQRSAAFGALVGLTTLVVLLQGVWAGLFLQRDADRSWVDVHAVGAYVAIALAVAATVVAVARLRSRRDLVTGSAVLAVLIIAETGLGAAVRAGTDGLTVVHVPLAMAIIGLAVWLPLRARGRA